MVLNINLKKWPFALNIAGCIQFIIVTALAMSIYEGGTYIDPSTSHYLFWYNYFSDLGRTVAHSGNINIFSCILFTIALSIWGLFQIPFYITFSRFFKKSKGLKNFSLIGSIFGVFAGIFYVGIALTPSDLVNLFHELFVFLGFGSIFLSIILYAIVIFKTENYANSYAFVFTISAVILGIYFVILLFTPNNHTAVGLFIYVLGQKFMIYTLLLCGIIQGFGATKHLSS